MQSILFENKSLDSPVVMDGMALPSQAGQHPADGSGGTSEFIGGFLQGYQAPFTAHFK
ncbi:MAG: hypothetical protein K9G42_00990 [Pedobacter sp.]|nr:hypothetical protein [Pedobacter sp.]